MTPAKAEAKSQFPSGIARPGFQARIASWPTHHEPKRTRLQNYWQRFFDIHKFRPSPNIGLVIFKGLSNQWGSGMTQITGSVEAHQQRLREFRRWCDQPQNVRAMTFTLSGFDPWTFQVVFYGGLLVLEAIQDDLRMSAVLHPMDDTPSRAHQLISRPSCPLISSPPSTCESQTP